MKNEHESFGMLSVSRYSGQGQQFFGSDLIHEGGVEIEISQADVERKYGHDYYHANKSKIRIKLSHSQYIDAITSGMNTQGVPCTITRVENKNIEQIEHAENKKDIFKTDMQEIIADYLLKIDEIVEKLSSGTLGKKKVAELKHDLSVLRSHLSSNMSFTMDTFDESMEKTVTEAKHSISNYVEMKIRSTGVEALKDGYQISLKD